MVWTFNKIFDNILDSEDSEMFDCGGKVSLGRNKTNWAIKILRELLACQRTRLHPFFSAKDSVDD